MLIHQVPEHPADGRRHSCPWREKQEPRGGWLLWPRGQHSWGLLLQSEENGAIAPPQEIPAGHIPTNKQKLRTLPLGGRTSTQPSGVSASVSRLLSPRLLPFQAEEDMREEPLDVD